MAIPTLSAYPLPQAKQIPVNKVDWQFDPAKAVLLIHDMQEYFVSFYGDNNPLIQQVIEHIVVLRRFCKSNGIPVIYTAQPNNQSSEDRALLNDMWGAGLNDHPAKQRVVHALTPDKDDKILVKWRYSAFHRSPLESMMKEMGRDQLVICGIYGHIGCMITATDAFMKDIKPFMVADAVADFTLEEHLMALKYVATRSGCVLFTEDLLGKSTAAAEKFSKEALKTQILALIDESAEDFDEDENLIDYGLNSVHIMALVTEWRQQGITLSFVDLARAPSLNGWWAVFEKQCLMGAK
ncbi:isochorismatase family protein [Yersinia ruckeri]|uniref:isochorismatase n=1 Tax=Yersinia ruckeri TaxID=29486 RepID=A0A085U3B8_YERRU|nr:isochorismatase family protein [Yersinia ruckeri]ARY99906.1 Isochorismatase [Yersinia ruckeri]AUQ42024.1 isochorismatase [Yersinia ruckeri]EEP98229.1 Enterobactin synthetase component B (Isochorismatase) [Yersinia ruckeri ATCC 29473]EKN4182438.1 isochorismatase family protein [Yersinia ruckeri]EKN4199577.1 isochorismatase family protein [Yersinia ruckeri]